MSALSSNKLSLKYQNFTSSGCENTGIRKFEFVAKTQFLWTNTPFKLKHETITFATLKSSYPRLQKSISGIFRPNLKQLKV